MLRWLRIPGLALFILILLAFPYGPLFPWSPIKPGYELTMLTRADVYSPKGKPLDPAYRKLDELIAQTEQYLQFDMPKRVTVIATADWSDFRRFMPTLPGRAVGAATVATGTVIYVTPKLAERNLDTAEFLLHELSHACLYQHTSIWNSQKMNETAWLFEGIAVSNGRQKAFITPADFKSRAPALDLTRVIGPTLNDLGPNLDIRFDYFAWRYFLEYVQATRGRDKFRELLQAFLDDPAAVNAAFARIYGLSVDHAVREFQQEIRLGTWNVETPKRAR